MKPVEMRRRAMCAPRLSLCTEGVAIFSMFGLTRAKRKHTVNIMQKTRRGTSLQNNTSIHQCRLAHAFFQCVHVAAHILPDNVAVAGG